MSFIEISNKKKIIFPNSVPLIVGPFDTYKRECAEEDVEDCYNNISEEDCHDEMLKDEVLPYVFEDYISDGEVPNTSTKGYLSDGEVPNTSTKGYLSDGEVPNTSTKGYLSDGEVPNTSTKGYLSDGEVPNTSTKGYLSDGEVPNTSTKGYLSDGEVPNTSTKGYLSDGEVPNTSTKGYLSDGEVPNTSTKGYLSDGEVPNTSTKGYLSDGEVPNTSTKGYLSDGEVPNTSTKGYLSDGEVPNTSTKGYLSDGELCGPCENELKYFLNIEDGRRCCGNEHGDGKTIKDIDNCLVDNMFDKITKVNRWLFPEGSDMDQEQEACCEPNNSSRNVSNASPDNSARNSLGDESNNLTDLTEVSIAPPSIVKKRKKRNLFIRFCNFVSKRFKRN